MLKICFIIVSCVTLLFSNRAVCSSVSDNIPPSYVIDVMDAAKSIHGFLSHGSHQLIDLEREMGDLRELLEATSSQEQESAKAYLSSVDQTLTLLDPVAVLAQTIASNAENLFQWHRGDEGDQNTPDLIKSTIKEAFSPLSSALSQFVGQIHPQLLGDFKSMKKVLKKCPNVSVTDILYHLKWCHKEIARDVECLPGYLATIQTYLDA